MHVWCCMFFFFFREWGAGREGVFFFFIFFYSLEHQNVRVIEGPTTIADIKGWSGLLLT